MTKIKNIVLTCDFKVIIFVKDLPHYFQPKILTNSKGRVRPFQPHPPFHRGRKSILLERNPTRNFIYPKFVLSFHYLVFISLRIRHTFV